MGKRKSRIISPRNISLMIVLHFGQRLLELEDRVLNREFS